VERLPSIDGAEFWCEVVSTCRYGLPSRRAILLGPGWVFWRSALRKGHKAEKHYPVGDGQRSQRH
jgi:hypothetical protein